MLARAVIPCLLVAAALVGAGCGTTVSVPSARPEVVVAMVPLQPTAAPSAAASAAPAPNEEGVSDEQEDPAEHRTFGLIGIGGASDPDAPPAPWATADQDDETAKGAVFGNGVAGSSIGLGTLGGSGGRTSGAPSIKTGAPSVSGRLPPAIIQRIVRQNLGRYRLCYENGLKAQPALAGQVTVKFVVGRDGSVSNVSNGGSDLPDSGVVSCVVRSFYGLAFPQPESGIVVVTYPIHFAPGTMAPAAASAAPSATPSAAPKAAPAAAPAPPSTP